MIFRKRYDYFDGEIHEGITFKLPSLARESEKDSCDINKIMSRYEKTGMIAHLNKKQGFFGDASSVEDYKTAADIFISAQEDFLNLPAKIRDRFKNSPLELLQFLEDDKNRDEAISLGLIDKTFSELPAGKPDTGGEPPVKNAE